MARPSKHDGVVYRRDDSKPTKREVLIWSRFSEKGFDTFLA